MSRLPVPPIHTASEARAFALLTDALTVPKQRRESQPARSIEAAARTLARTLDGHGAYEGGIRQLLWDARRHPEHHAELVRVLARTLKLAPDDWGAGFMRAARFLVPSRKPRDVAAGASKMSTPASSPTPTLAAPGDFRAALLGGSRSPEDTPERVRWREQLLARLPEELARKALAVRGLLAEGPPA